MCPAPATQRNHQGRKKIKYMTANSYIHVKITSFSNIILVTDIDSMKEMCTIPISQKRTGF